MAFDIRDYIWNIFEVSRAQDLDNIRIALDLFIVNMELKRERYEGASSVDYKTIGEQWNCITDAGHVHQKIVFNKVIHSAYTQLCDAWKAKDKEKFNRLCYTDLTIFGIPETDPNYTNPSNERKRVTITHSDMVKRKYRKKTKNNKS